MYTDGLGRIEDLHIQLCDLLLDGIGRGGGIQFSLSNSQLILFDCVLVAVSVPDGPVAIYRIRTVVIHLVHARHGVTIGHRGHTTFCPRTVGGVLRRRSVERGQQGRLALQYVFLCT